MLTKVEAHTSRVSPADLLLVGEGPSTDPFQVRNISGLGPVKSSINTTPFASRNGESYIGSWGGKRNIVLTLGLNPDWVDQTIGGLRQVIYKHFMPGQSVTLRFFSDILPTCDIVGYVESCDPNIFSKDPEMQISIICPEPDFVAVTPTVINGIILAAPFGTPDYDDYTPVDYIGTNPTGFKMILSDSVLVPEYIGGTISINNVIDSPGLAYVETLTFDATIDPVTTIFFSSIDQQKYIRSESGSIITSLLNTVYSGEKWPILIPGENRISVTAEEEGQEWSLEYNARFGGL